MTAVSAPSRQSLDRDSGPGSRAVLATVAVLVVGQLAYRGWATWTSWYHYDDFNFMSRMWNQGLSPSVAFEEYAGHVMPAGMYLSWLASELAPYDFRVTTVLLLLMQAVADAGLVVLLVRLFGVRPGILPPLCVYLFGSISAPVAIWWAAGVNQLPMQAALFWSIACFVPYLRTHRVRHLLSTLAWLVVGLAFYEKTLLVLGALGLVTICYFTSGGVRQRLATIWRLHRVALLALVGLGLAYLALYVRYALTFSPAGVGSPSLPEVMSNMVTHVYLPAVFGGPLRWWKLDQWALPTPGGPIILVSLVLAGLLVNEIRRCRTRSLRAWSLVVFFLGSDVLLVVAGRASFVGALISLDFRFQGEMGAVTAVALALATMPIIGAPEQVEVRRRGEFLGRPRLVTAAVVVVSALGLVSSTQYVLHWRDSGPAEAYFGHLLPALDDASTPITLADDTVPPGVMWGLGYPDNTLSHLLRPYPQVHFADVASDRIGMVAEDGTVSVLAVDSVRASTDGPHRRCGWRVEQSPVTIPLDGPVAFGGWWVRIGYLSSGDSPVRVTAGDVVHDTTVRAGVHALYFAGGGSFDSVTIGGLADGVSLCTDDVTVGRAVPLSELEEKK